MVAEDARDEVCLRLAGAGRQPRQAEVGDLARQRQSEDGRAREVHQAQAADRAGGERQEGGIRRAGQEVDVHPRKDQGRQAPQADRQVQAGRPGRRDHRLRQRHQPDARQHRAADRGRRHRPRAPEDLQPAEHPEHAGEYEGPRVDGRPRPQGAAGADQGRRPPGPEHVRHRPDGPAAARSQRHVQLGREAVHDLRLDRQLQPRPCAPG